MKSTIESITVALDYLDLHGKQNIENYIPRSGIDLYLNSESMARKGHVKKCLEVALLARKLQGKKNA